MIEHLGDLLRLSIESRDREEIPLAEELAFLDHYLAIQRIRFGDKLRIDMRIDPDVMYASVPCLFIQPLVENAIRHGISRRASGGTVIVSAERAGGRLRRPRDRRWRRPARWLDVSRRRAGLGLSLTRDRIAGLYPNGTQPVRHPPPSGRRHGSRDRAAVERVRRRGPRCRLRLIAFVCWSSTMRLRPGSGSSTCFGKDAGVGSISEAANGLDAVELIRGERPDLVFLDVQMPELDGLGVIDAVGATAMPLTVFVTAYDQHAVHAFEANALDYLLKPYSDERQEAAMARARQRLHERSVYEFGQRMLRLTARSPQRRALSTGWWSSPAAPHASCAWRTSTASRRPACT